MKMAPKLTDRNLSIKVLGALASLCLLVVCVAALAADVDTAPKFKFDPDWPKPLPNKWKMGGVTGLGRGQGRQRLGLRSSQRSDRHRARGGADSSACRLLRPAAVDDPHRQERQRHRLLRRAAGARHGGRQQRIRLPRDRTRSANTIRRPASLSPKCLARPRGRRAAVEAMPPPDGPRTSGPRQRGARRGILLPGGRPKPDPAARGSPGSGDGSLPRQVSSDHADDRGQASKRFGSTNRLTNSTPPTITSAAA